MTEWEEVTPSSGTYVQWGKPGQVVEGTLLEISLTAGRAFDESECPELRIDTADGTQIVTCGQANLRRWVNQQNLAQYHVGGPIRIEYLKDEPLAGGKSYKSFNVKTAKPALTDVSGF
jgi:hypothetical protein